LGWREGAGNIDDTSRVIKEHERKDMKWLEPDDWYKGALPKSKTMKRRRRFRIAPAQRKIEQSSILVSTRDRFGLLISHKQGRRLKLTAQFSHTANNRRHRE
jgi:hypothetical protein